MLIVTSCFSQGGIYQLNSEIRALDKIINNNDTLIVISSDMLLETNKLIIKEAIQRENIDSLGVEINKCISVVNTYSKIVDTYKQTNTILDNEILIKNIEIKKLKNKNKIHKIKSYAFGGVAILVILKLIL